MNSGAELHFSMPKIDSQRPLKSISRMCETSWKLIKKSTTSDKSRKFELSFACLGIRQYPLPIMLIKYRVRPIKVENLSFPLRLSGNSSISICTNKVSQILSTSDKSRKFDLSHCLFENSAISITNKVNQISCIKVENPSFHSGFLDLSNINFHNKVIRNFQNLTIHYLSNSNANWKLIFLILKKLRGACFFLLLFCVCDMLFRRSI